MEPFYGFVLFALIVAGVAWFLFALKGERREKRRNHAAATTLASGLVCPTCYLPTLQWSQEVWDAELEYVDGSRKLEHGFTYFCPQCSRLYDFTSAGEYREPSEE
jgi:hypothetical protein